MLLANTRGCRVIMSAPAGIGMSNDVLDDLRAGGVAVDEEPDLARAAGQSDVVYVTRVQKERFPSDDAYQAARGTYRFTAESLAMMKRDAIVMHPLPRVDEVDPAVDVDPRAAYFRQARNGVYLRMALLDILLGYPPHQA
jgi:aspartate carbamoyltransferase catalytic subunit